MVSLPRTGQTQRMKNQNLRTRMQELRTKRQEIRRKRQELRRQRQGMRRKRQIMRRKRQQGRLWRLRGKRWRTRQQHQSPLGQIFCYTDPAHVQKNNIKYNEAFVKFSNSVGPCRPLVQFPKNQDGWSFQGH